MNVCVVIPTYNEAENLVEAVTRALASYDGLRVLVVDDNSTDGTAAIADGLAVCHDGVAVVHRPAKAGLGTAYRHGFSVAIADHAEVILEMDADLSHQPESIPALVEQIRAGADVAIGSRYVPGGGTVGWPMRRQLLSRLGNLYMRALTRTSVRDATGGFRAFAAEAATRYVLPTESEGYAFQIETVVRCQRAGLRIREVPITFVERRAGASKMNHRIVAEAIRFGWRARTIGLRRTPGEFPAERSSRRRPLVGASGRGGESQ